MRFACAELRASPSALAQLDRHGYKRRSPGCGEPQLLRGATDALEQAVFEQVAKRRNLGFQNTTRARHDPLDRDRSGKIRIFRRRKDAVANWFGLRIQRRCDFAIVERARLDAIRHIEFLRRSRRVVAAPFQRAIGLRQLDPLTLGLVDYLVIAPAALAT